MPLRHVALAACLVLGGRAHADTIVTSQPRFSAAASNATQTTSLGLQYYSHTSSVTLSDGNVLKTLGDEVAASGTGYSPFTNGYGGDVLITTGATETVSFSHAINALGFYVSPDVGLTLGGLHPSAASFLVTLSNGQTETVGGTYGDGDVSFVGFYGVGDITSMTITVSGTNALTGAAIADFAVGDFFSVPEPASMALLVGGMTVLGVARRRRV